MKKFICSTLVITCLLLAPTFSFADSSNNGIEEQDLGVSLNLKSDGNLSENNERAAGSYVTSEVIDSYTLKNQFIGYNSFTPDWSKASGYTLHSGKTYTFSASVSTKWGKATVKGSYKVGGVDINFTADPQRESRLAAKSDVKVSKIQYKKWVNGNVVDTWTNITTEPIGAKTNYVAYK